VNNAGIYKFAPLDQITPEEFHKHFDLNVLGVNGIKYVSSRRIINYNTSASSDLLSEWWC
jgi:3-oxoacyl-[acyl-carrier protein] reductase